MVLTEADKRVYEGIEAEIRKGEVANAEERELATLGFIRHKCTTDLYYLGAYILGLDKVVDPKTKRRRLDPVVHKPMAEMLGREEDTLQLEPRGHLKSYWMKVLAVQKLLQNPRNRIGFWTKTSKLARKELKFIKVLLMNPILQEAFPDVVLKREQWEKDTADELLMSRFEDDEWRAEEQEFQIEVWGVDSTVVGHHYDYHFYDDIIDEDSVTTADQLEKVREWWSMCQAIKEISGVEKMIGTRYHYHDIYGEVLEEEYFDRDCIRTTQAIVNGKPYYRFFTMKDLNRIRRRMGERRFQLQYMNTVVMEEDKIFIPPYPFYDHLPENPEYYMTVDPAIGSRYSTAAGIAIGCIAPQDKRLHVVEAIGVDRPSNELARTIIQYVDKYRPKIIGIEFGLQAALETLIRMEHVALESRIKERVPLHLEEVPVRIGKMSKPQKIERTLGGLVREGRVVFNRFGMKDLFRQMTFLNPHTPEANEDDIVDAVSMLTMIVPIFPQNRWWKKFPDMGGSNRGMTVEEFIDMMHKKERKWDSRLAI